MIPEDLLYRAEPTDAKHRAIHYCKKDIYILNLEMVNL